MEDSWLSDLLYRAEIKEILLFGLGSLTLSDATLRAVEVTYVGPLHQIMRNQARWNADKAWETPAAEELLWLAGTQLEANYIVLQKVTVAQWVALISLMRVCTQKNG